MELTIHDGQLVTVGSEGAILRSRLIPDPTPINMASFARSSGMNVFLFTGAPDQQFRLQSSPDLVTWTDGALLEFLDSSGTLLYVEDTGTNAPADQFYRARTRAVAATCSEVWPISFPLKGINLEAVGTVRAFRLTSFVIKHDWRFRQTRRDLGGRVKCAHANQFCRPFWHRAQDGFSDDPLQHVFAGGCCSVRNFRGNHPRPKSDAVSSSFLRGAGWCKAASMA